MIRVHYLLLDALNELNNVKYWAIEHRKDKKDINQLKLIYEHIFQLIEWSKNLFHITGDYIDREEEVKNNEN